jgi:hypothetical protein
MSANQVYSLLETNSKFPRLVLNRGPNRARLWSKSDVARWAATNKETFQRSYIYYAECGQYLKIGISKNPRGRVEYLKKDPFSHFDDVEMRQNIRLLGYVPGTLKQEKDILKKFIEHRAFDVGEWFYDVPQIRQYMKKLTSF